MKSNVLKKLYVKLLLLIAVFVLVFGFLAPTLISANHTELVLLGVVIIAITVPVLYRIGVQIFKIFIEEVM